jgi:hypothetical protein
MITITSIEKNYGSFTDEHKSEGYCFGFCLTWLGDILKDRSSQYSGRWYSGWFTPVKSPEKKALLPTDYASQRRFFDRARRKQENSERRADKDNADGFSVLEHEEVTVNYKNRHQREKEIITGVPGLKYSLRERSSFMAMTTLNANEDKNPSSGMIIKFQFSDEGEAAHHAVAAFRYSEFESFFLDPNYGLFKTVSAYPMLEIVDFLSGKYQDPIAVSEIIVTKKLKTG